MDNNARDRHKGIKIGNKKDGIKYSKKKQEFRETSQNSQQKGEAENDR